ncbi:enoyl-CoA hydratase/isomerase family protein [Halosegnis marinus]|uniref:Enoyl-CoA hydratase/isomerase family protein n=1 Tax=Halosegnis marinus TaxID=3034023 RepID=A0ABD5ZRX0_9EURY|nr:enoyl-CoA hydratase-related protein [Halosegnis sp. DT85]
MSDDAVLLDVENGVATMTLNKPEVRNALTAELSHAIIDTIDDLETRDDVRCLVVTGQEGTFCAGGDINSMVERMSGDMPLHDAVRNIQQVTSRAVRRVYEFHRPTVAKVDGAAFGAGGNLAIACDCLVASERARIGFGFRQVGLAVDSGTSYLLPRIVGENVAKELVFTGELLDAERASELGIFNHVYEDFDAEAEEFVASIAEGPSVALETSKRLIEQGLSSDLKQAQDDEAAAQAAVFATHDHEEGATAFMESRSPEFEGE